MGSTSIEVTTDRYTLSANHTANGAGEYICLASTDEWMSAWDAGSGGGVYLEHSVGWPLDPSTTRMKAPPAHRMV